MKELTTTHKILLFLSAIILVNILLFVLKSRTIGGDSILGRATSLQNYVLKNYDNFHIFSNETDSTNSFLTLLSGNGDNATKPSLQVNFLFVDFSFET